LLFLVEEDTVTDESIDQSLDPRALYLADHAFAFSASMSHLDDEFDNDEEEGEFEDDEDFDDEFEEDDDDEDWEDDFDDEDDELEDDDEDDE
jgi:hypothetical protein